MTTSLERESQLTTAPAVPPLVMTPTPDLLSQLLLTREQVAEVLNVTPECVKHLHRMKQLPAVKVGKSNMWKPETVRTFVDGLEPGKES